MTVKEAARQLELAPSTVYLLCQQGRIPHCRLGTKGNRIRISEDDLALYRARTYQPMREPDEAPAAKPAGYTTASEDMARAMDLIRGIRVRR